MALLSLSCGMWDLVPCSGIEPGHPSWGAQSQPLDHRGGPTSLLTITCYKHFLKLEDKTRVSTNTTSTSYCPLVGGGEQSRPQRPGTTPPHTSLTTVSSDHTVPVASTKRSWSFLSSCFAELLHSSSQL